MLPGGWEGRTLAHGDRVVLGPMRMLCLYLEKPLDPDLIQNM